ncbi:MAG: DUF3685 domain-containing protein [Oscillatoriaceae cyanobacterium]
MTNDRRFQILASSDDPLLLLGLEAILAPFPDLELVASCSTGAITLELLAQVFFHQTDLNQQNLSDYLNEINKKKSPNFPEIDKIQIIHSNKKKSSDPNQSWNQSNVDVPSTQRPASVPDSSSSVLPSNLDLVILDLDQGSPQGDTISGITLYHQVASQYPQVPILLLSSFIEPPDRLTSGAAKGYCSKRGDPQTLVSAIRACAAGQTYWPPQSRPTSGLSQPSPGRRRPDGAGKRRSPLIEQLAAQLNQPRAAMDAEVAALDAGLRQPSISAWDRFFLSGRRREVLTARAIVNWILGSYSPVGSVGNAGSLGKDGVQGSKGAFEQGIHGPGDQGTREPGDQGTRGPVSGSLRPPVPPNSLSSPVDSTLAKGLQSALFEATLDKIALTQLRNLTDVALEIDILRQEKKQQLCFLILRQLEDLLSKLRFSQVTEEQLRILRRGLLRDLWVDATTEFFGKYTSVRVRDRQLEIVPVLLQDDRKVRENILEKIPYVVELFSHLLFHNPLTVDNESYAPGTPAAMQQAEFLLHNLTIMVANATIQPLLNQFGDVEEIKQNFYDRRWISTREIERFRNNLSWKYRWEKYWREPKAIFESQYLLVVIDERGIKNQPIYGPRNQEMAELNGVQQTVTLLLETRDAISPRVRSILVGIGIGSRYLLLQLGRGIGFIGQGIIQGIGTSLADIRKGQHRRPD